MVAPIRLTGHYQPLPATGGTLTLTLSHPLTDPAGNIIVPVEAHPITLDPDGRFTIDLPPSRGDSLSPPGQVYIVDEHVGTPRRYPIIVAHDRTTGIDADGIATVDLAGLVPVAGVGLPLTDAVSLPALLAVRNALDVRLGLLESAPPGIDTSALSTALAPLARSVDVTAEVTARTTADISLSARATALELALPGKASTTALATEVTDRTAADSALTAAVSLRATTVALTTETVARTQADADAAAAASATYRPAAVAVPGGNTAALQALLDGVSPGALVVLGAGASFSVTGLTATVRCIIDATGATITQAATGAATNLLTLAADGCEVIGGTWDGNKAAQTVDNTGILITGHDAIIRPSVLVKNTKGIGVHGMDADRPRIQCRVLNSAGAGILVEAASRDIFDPVIDGARVDRTGLPAASIAEGGIKVHGSGNGTFRAFGVQVRANTSRLPVSPADFSCLAVEVWGGCPGAIVTGNSTFGGSIGVSIDNSPGTVADANVITGASSYGLEVVSSPNSTGRNVIDGGNLTQRGVMITNSAGCSVTGTVRGVLFGVYAQGSPRTRVSAMTIEMGSQSGGKSAVYFNSSDGGCVNACDMLGTGAAGGCDWAVQADNCDSITVTSTREQGWGSGLVLSFNKPNPNRNVITDNTLMDAIPVVTWGGQTPGALVRVHGNTAPGQLVTVT